MRDDPDFDDVLNAAQGEYQCYATGIGRMLTTTVHRNSRAGRILLLLLSGAVAQQIPIPDKLSQVGYPSYVTQDQHEDKVVVMPSASVVPVAATHTPSDTAHDIDGHRHLGDSVVADEQEIIFTAAAVAPPTLDPRNFDAKDPHGLVLAVQDTPRTSGALNSSPPQPSSARRTKAVIGPRYRDRVRRESKSGGPWRRTI